jgi:predicted MFS family arabinose efflux permease
VGVASPQGLVALLSAALFLVRAVFMMMGPLLVILAAAFDTSVAATGQLAAAIGISWGITAPLVGPVSDVYGRRRVGLAGLTLMAVIDRANSRLNVRNRRREMRSPRSPLMS